MRFEPKWLPGRIWHPAHVRSPSAHPLHMQVMPSIHNKIALGGWEQCGNAHFVGHSSWRSARRKISSGTTIGIVHAHFVGRSKIDLTSISDTKMFGMCRIQYGKEISYLYPTKKYVVSVGYNPNRTTRTYCIYIYIYIS